MKVAIILTIVSVVSGIPAPTPGRQARSFDHYSDFGAPEVYSAQNTGYSTHSVSSAPVYTYPERTEVHTTSNTHYKVQVPVTYTYTVEQPSHHSTVYHHSPPAIPAHSTVYETAPVVSHSNVYSSPSYSTVYSAPPAVYTAPTTVYSGPVRSSRVYSVPAAYPARRRVYKVLRPATWNAVRDPWC